MRVITDRGVSGHYGGVGNNKDKKGDTDVWTALIAALGEGYKARQARKGQETALRTQHAERMAAIKAGVGHIPTVFGPYSSVNSTAGSLNLGQLIVPAAVIGGVGLLGIGAIMVLKD